MSYQVIARKWRPQTFEEVTGQEAITRTLRNAIEHDRLHHAYIFSGSRGVGKTTTARLLAKSLNCHKTEKPNPKPCDFGNADACVSCKEISESRSIDVFEFDAASHTGVDDIRELILESININPARDRYKVFIIDEVHMLSNSSFNALLKTLEEPPPRVEFIMATTELHKLPDTILSRCQEFEFRSIPLNKIFERLKLIADAEKINISDEALKEIARSGEGSMRDAQSNFDQVISFSGEKIGTEEVVSALGIASAEMLTKTLNAITENKPAEVLKVVDELISRGQDLRNFCRDLLSFFRDLLVVKMAGDIENLLDTAILHGDELRKYAEPFSESDLIRFFNSLSETELKLHDALQPRYMLEIGLVKLIEMRRVTPIEKLLERIAKLESAISNGNLEISSENKVNQSNQNQPIQEKKTLTTDIPLEEIPFPVTSSSYSQKIEETIEEQEPEIQESDFIEEEIAPPVKKETSEFIENFKAEFVDKISIDLSLITSEELEHIEDKWLDEAYEKKLLLSGDELNLIPNASIIVENLIGNSNKKTEVQAESSNGSSAVAFARAKEISRMIPQINEEEVSEEIPELPENPTEEQLYKYAESHPLVKKALKIFRGKIIEVKKI
jgi:DNA polymerase III subunit gamma/tau